MCVTQAHFVTVLLLVMSECLRLFEDLVGVFSSRYSLFYDLNKCISKWNMCVDALSHII